MIFRRKVYQRLLEWKRRSGGRTALLIEGARRVGKTTIAREFAEHEYESYVLIDFSNVTEEFKRTFLDTRIDLDSFFLYLSATYGVRLEARKSLVLFDEVQLFPQAREFIKHLVADGRFDYIETGSLISIKANTKGILIPSEEESTSMHPLDFEEFCWATGEEALASLIASSFESRRPLSDSLHRKAMRLWNEYMLVGGMPQAIESYREGRDMASADAAKRLVIKLYREDIEKYGGITAKRLKAVFDAIPGQLAKHEKRLVYAQVDKNSRARDYATAFSWFKEAGTVNLCVLSTDPSLGLALSADDSAVKCYMADTGLLATMAFSAAGNALPEVYRRVLLGDSGVNQGMFAENAVAQQLVASGHELYFYSRSSLERAERMEIDFLIVRRYADAGMKPRISPIEVKSSKRYTAVSLEKFKAKFGKRVGAEYILHPRQMVVEDDRMRLPLYMAHLL